MKFRRAPLFLLVNNTRIHSIHFTGILGSGMSALAQFLRWKGLNVSGSDRLIKNVENHRNVSLLSKIGCLLYPQDGSGISEKIDAICISTAIESNNADIKAAEKFSIPILHRSDVLAAIVNEYKTLAIAGTSGKSTVTAMVYEFLTACGKSPSLISGAPLIRLEKEGMIGNAFYGNSNLLVVEADESDGTIIKYKPYICVLLNISKDHKPVEEIKELFKRVVSSSNMSIKNADDPNLEDIETTYKFSLYSPSNWYPEKIEIKTDCGVIVKDGVKYILPLIGEHNLYNCAAALYIAELVGCKQTSLQDAVSKFKGVARRFNVRKTKNDIFVVDDFAHNPAKIKAAITSARSLSKRIIAIYQPHGFGPTRFLRDEYKTLFSSIFSKEDMLFLLPIYYAGGTAIKDISSVDLKNDLGKTSFPVFTPEKREDVLNIILKEAKVGDCILVMGARDPSLSAFVESIFFLLERSS